MKKEIHSGDGYSFYKYFRKRPSFLITIVTVTISILSFILNTIVVSLRCRYFDYWGYNLVGSSITKSNNSIFLGFFIWLILTVFINNLVLVIFDVYFKNRGHFALINRESREIKKDLKGIKKDTKKHIGISTEKGIEIIDRVQLMESTNNRNRNFIKSIHCRIRLELFVSSLVSILLFYCCYYFFYLLLPVYINKKTYYIVVTCFIAFWFLLSFIINFILYVLERKERESAIIEMTDDEFRKKAKELILSFPLRKLRNYKIKDYLSDSNIRNYSIGLVFLLTIFVLFTSLVLDRALLNNRTFQILEIDNYQYAVIVTDDNYFYCDKAVIDGDTIIINKNNHLIIPKGNALYYEKTFDDVVRYEEYDKVVFDGES